MTLELLLQILVFPGLGWLALQIQDVKVSLAVMAHRVTEVEKEQTKHETQDTCPHCIPKPKHGACGAD